MIISINWLKKFTDIDVSIDELATLIGSRLVEIEDVVKLGDKYEGVIIAKVIECAPLEGSDHLNVTKIDDGGVAQDVERDENGLVQVVCGAPNVRVGLTVAWLPPSSTVPETFNDKEPFVLGARKLRGVMSNGMLASAKELDLYDEHNGILEIDKEAEPGASFAELYELDDSLLDIENKSLTHRPDTFGVIGFAREIAAIQGKQFKTPKWLTDFPVTFIEKNGDVQAPEVTIDNAELSAKYAAVVLSDADGSLSSPVEIQSYLARVGVRPISAVVDVTNYLMMLTGQPLHAFDYDKLCALNNGKADIHVRAGRQGETLELLDGRTIEISDNDIIIANGDVPVALAGAMGGAATEIDDTTKNIILESATFNLYNLRNTQMRHGIFSEAITRFTKGQPPLLSEPMLAEAVRLLGELTGAKRVSDVVQTTTDTMTNEAINITAEEVNKVLGSKFTLSDVVETLGNAEFICTVDEKGTAVSVVAPFWRSDIHITEDIVEEVGRLNGFDSIEPTLPRRDFRAVAPADFDQLRAKIRQALSRAGANEVLNYSFVHGDLLQKAGQKPKDSYRITNSLSPDLQYYRQTLTPSLLQLIHPNIKSGFDSFALYELNKAHVKIAGMDDDGTPMEIDYVALTVVNKKPMHGAPYYAAKKYLDYLAKSFELEFVYSPIEKDVDNPGSAPYEYRRSAMVHDRVSGEYIGIVGEYRKSVQKAFKLPEYVAGFEIDPRGIENATIQNGLRYAPLSRYPSTERDVCFQVTQSVTYADIVDAAQRVLAASELTSSVEPVDIYQPDDTDVKNITVRIKLVSHQRTLAAEEINTVIDEVITKVSEATQAIVV
jgi:phenylalanyl-tRNA synthetase beta chain